jgi:DNA-binding beta-propeller fold protein YncE
MRPLPTLIALLFSSTFSLAQAPAAPTGAVRHLLYVAVPGIRDYAQYGGNGVLVFDIDRDHKFVRRINVPAMGTPNKSQAAKGICASSVTGKLYVSNTKSVTCIDLTNDAIVWEKSYDDGCDRMSISADGKTIFEPTLEGKYWHVIDAETGDEITRIPTDAGAHNTVFGLDGKHVYLAALHSPMMVVADATTRAKELAVGPFAAPIRPFTVNAACTLCYVNVNELLGFEVGDLKTGKKLYRVEVQGFEKGETKRHGCPSHGIGLTPDEKELWLTDAHNSRLHIFDNTVMPPKQKDSIALHDQPGWITFTIDGRFAYPSSGEIIDVSSHKIISTLKDEHGHEVQSEKLMEVDFFGGKPVHAGDQFGLGRATLPTAQ